MTKVLQDDNGQVLPTHSVSAGLDYPAVGPEHPLVGDGRVRRKGHRSAVRAGPPVDGDARQGWTPRQRLSIGTGSIASAGVNPNTRP